MQVLKYGQQKCRVESSTATKRNELVLYYCTWQSELGHQGSKGSKYIGLKRVSTHILILCMVYVAVTECEAKLTQVFSYGTVYYIFMK